MKRWIGAIVAVAIGVIIWLGLMVTLGSKDPSADTRFYLIGYPVSLLAAAVLGFFFEDLLWSFGLAIMFSQFCMGLITAPGDRNLAPPGAVFFAILAIPLIFSSYIGRFIAKRMQARS